MPLSLQEILVVLALVDNPNQMIQALVTLEKQVLLK
jgi:hypothetical protein